MAKRLLSVLLAIVVALVVIGFLLPREVTVERSRLIDQPAERIYEVLADFRHFEHWSPWLRDGDEAGYRVEGRPGTVGSALVWADEQGSGAGRMWIVAMDPPRRIDLQMELGDNLADSYFLLESEGLAQRVSWGMQTRFGPFDLTGRYVGLMLPGLIGRSYSDGLERLEAYLAATPGQVPALDEDTAQP